MRGMTSFKIGNKLIGQNYNEIFVIAEIGQNHQGSVVIAKEMISKAKECGCDCVKFQKSCLQAKFTKSALDRSYEGPNSWGKTYGEHKHFLEFSIDEFKELQNYANEVGILFSASAMDEISLQELLKLNLPFIKIGSGDANNFRLIETAAHFDTPLIISTGMQSMQTIERIVKIMEVHRKENFCLLHCISAYPTKPEDTSLGIIQLFKEKFPKLIIGYSGHEEGTLISKVAILQGAKVIERHFTLNKTQKGSDHISSMLPQEFEDLIKFARKVEAKCFKGRQTEQDCINLLASSPADEQLIKKVLRELKNRQLLDCEKPCRNKLGKSIVYARNLLKGHIMQKEDLTVKVSEPFGVSAENLELFIGAKLNKNVYLDDILLKSHFNER